MNQTRQALSAFLLFLLIGVASAGEAPHVLWTSPCLVTNFDSQRGGGQVLNVVPDESGGCYYFGNLWPSALVNGASVPDATNGLPRFLTHLDSNGRVVWFKRLGPGPINSNLLRMNDGTLLLAGTYVGEAELDGKIIQTSGTGGLLIAAFDSRGNCIWTKQPSLKADSILIADKLELDQKGNLVIPGAFAHTLSTPTGKITTQSHWADLFLSRCATNGTLLSTVAIHGNGVKSIAQIAIDSKNCVLVIGEFEGALDVAGTHLESKGRSDAFVAKFDEAGTGKWAKAFGGAKADGAYSIVIDPNDNSYVAGMFCDAADFAGTSMKAAEGSLFLCKLNPAGDLAWVRAYGNAGYTVSSGLIIASHEKLILRGYHEGGKFKLGELPVLAPTFIAGFNTTGDILWTRELEGSPSPDKVRLAKDAKGDIYLSGTADRLPMVGANERFVFAISKMSVQ